MSLKASTISLRELVKDLPPLRMVQERDKLRDVVESMSTLSQESNMVAAVTSSENPGHCVGVIGKFELVDHLVTFIHKEGMGRTEEELSQMIKERLGDSAAHFISMKESRNPGKLEVEDTLDKFIEMMAKGASRAVLTEGGQLTQVLTDSAVLRFLWTRALEADSPDLGKTIEQLGIFKGPSKVLVMYEDKPAITGFALMAIHGVKSLPIVGLDGKMYTTLGEADLKGITIPAIKKLALPVLDYLRLQHGSSLKQPYCKKSATLREVVTIMEDCHVSRVWVTDDHRRVIGAVAVTSVVSYLGSVDRRLAD